MSGVNGNLNLDELSADAVSFDVSGLTANSSDLLGLTQTQQVVSALANRHFGKSFFESINAATFTTSSSTFQEVATLNATNISAGKYILMFQGLYEKTLVAGMIESRFKVDGVAVGPDTHLPLPDDDFLYANPCFFFATLAAGNRVISVDVRKSAGGGTVSVSGRQLAMWRVS